VEDSGEELLRKAALDASLALREMFPGDFTPEAVNVAVSSSIYFINITIQPPTNAKEGVVHRHRETCRTSAVDVQPRRYILVLQISAQLLQAFGLAKDVPYNLSLWLRRSLVLR
jgi:hypothetical protein